LNQNGKVEEKKKEKIEIVEKKEIGKENGKILNQNGKVEEKEKEKIEIVEKKEIGKENQSFLSAPSFLAGCLIGIACTSILFLSRK